MIPGFFVVLQHGSLMHGRPPIPKRMLLKLSAVLGATSSAKEYIDHVELSFQSAAFGQILFLHSHFVICTGNYLICVQPSIMCARVFGARRPRLGLTTPP
jgi:hypothetical protein